VGRETVMDMDGSDRALPRRRQRGDGVEERDRIAAAGQRDGDRARRRQGIERGGDRRGDAGGVRGRRSP